MFVIYDHMIDIINEEYEQNLNLDLTIITELF